MAALVTVEAARLHLRLTPAESTGSPAGSPGSPAAEDEDLTRKIEAASDMIRTFLLRPDDAAWSAAVEAWTEADVPAIVQAAVLLQVADLYAHRGDEATAGPAGQVCPAAEAILRAMGYRDPVLA